MMHFVVALQCEARPLIAHYRLQGKNLDNGFRLYERDGVRLIVAGVGKIAAAAATAYLHAITAEQRHNVWLNVGVAGHSHRAVGEGLVAHKIIDSATGHCWYPPLIASPKASSDVLITFDRPATDYRESALYDMEGAAFYATATRFSSAETVQCFKVVSDNRDSPAAQIAETHVTALLQAKLEDITAFAAELLDLSRQLSQTEAPPPGYAEIIEHWRFSAYERNRLRRLLQRWHALMPEQPAIEAVARFNNGREFMAHLEWTIEAQPVSLTGAAP